MMTKIGKATSVVLPMEAYDDMDAFVAARRFRSQSSALRELLLIGIKVYKEHSPIVPEPEVQDAVANHS